MLRSGRQRSMNYFGIHAANNFLKDRKQLVDITTVLSRAVLSSLCNAPLSCPAFSRRDLCCPVLFCRAARNVLSRPVLSCPVLSCPVLFSVVLSRAVLSGRVVSCPVLRCPVLSFAVLSCPLRSNPVLFRAVLFSSVLSCGCPVVDTDAMKHRVLPCSVLFSAVLS